MYKNHTIPKFNLALLILHLTGIFYIIPVSAQKERLKGNKIVKTEQRPVEDFHTLEISDDFSVILDQGSDNIVTVEADGNFQEFILSEVQEGVLRISAERDFRRYKALEIRIYYNSEIHKLILHNKTSLKSLSPLKSSELQLQMNDNSETFLTLQTDYLKTFLNNKAKAELHTTAKNAFYQVNADSELEGILVSDSLKIDLYQNAKATLEGKTKSALVRVDNTTNFYAEKLTVLTAMLIAEGSSKCYIHTENTIDISATDSAEVYLMGEPKITISTFAKEATLYKKNADYKPGPFRF